MEEIKDIKIGETYNMRVKVISVDIEDNKGTGVATIPVDENGKELDDEWAYYGLDIVSAFSPITPENGIKNTVSAPKYDPCRLFRKGDKVRVVDEKNGRTPPCCGDIEAGELYTVSDDEDGGDVMLAVNGKYDCIKWYWLELVTPVEELEPYKVNHIKELELFEVCHYEMGDDTIEEEGEQYKIVRTIYWYGKRRLDRTVAQAKAEAEAECARLNAEYRKEMGK